MKYNIFGYLIGEGFSNVFKNKKSTGASLIIMCATMIIFGIFLILGENINNFVTDIKSEQGFQVFLKTDATEEEIQEVGDKIRALDGISTIEPKTKQDAVNIMKERLNDEDGILDELDYEVFSSSFVVTVTDLSLSKDIQNEILSFDNIKKITSSDQTVSTLLSLAKGIKLVTGIILILLVVISIFIISNTIKLTVHARRKEISIMKYVGATNNFIRWPFIVEGMIIGIFASLVSIVIVGTAYSLIADQAMQADFIQLMNMSLVGFSEMLSSIIFTYMLLGIGIGAFGSVISMRKYLKV
ncbi:MAG: ABC transporter permease [Clostridia bacterium]|nr:ABC transporter permease [Clostridia bacterium]